MRELNERTHADIVIIPQQKRKAERRSAMSPKEILLRIFGFLAARAVPLPGIAPFGIAFLSTERILTPGYLISFLSVILGYLSLGDWYCLRYLGSAAIIIGCLLCMEKPVKLSSKSMALLSAGSLSLFHALSMLWNGFNFYHLFLMLIDSAMTALGIMVFDRCKGLFAQQSSAENAPSDDEILSVWLLSGVALLSLQNLWGAQWFSLAHVGGFVLLGILSISGGLYATILGGPIIGILIGMGGDFLGALATFSLTGLLAGSFGRIHRHASLGVLALSGTCFAFYLWGNHAPLFRYLESTLSAGLLLLLPDTFFQSAKGFIPTAHTDTKNNETQEQLTDRLSLAADSFRTLAHTFVQLSDKEEQADSREVAALFDVAASHVCRTCSKATECWKRNFNATYQTLYQLLDRLERKGAVRKLDVDPFFSDRCLKLDAFLTEINRLYEIYKINRVWKQKLCENRLLVGEQFQGVAHILDRLSADFVHDIDTNHSLCQKLTDALKHRGISVNDVSLSREADGRQSVLLSMQHSFSSDHKRLLSALQETFGKTFAMTRESNTCLRFRETPTLTIETGTASSQKEEECGDAHGLNQLQQGKYIATLSDGMGTGHRASQESNATISLLNAFLNAGFDKTVAIKLINSVMVMKSAKEAFTTLDLCMIDLYTGEVEFIKNGAEPSYIKRETGTETVRSASLPVGVLSGVEVETFAHKLSCGDTIVMVSDGLALKDSGGDWLRRLIDSSSLNVSPQDLADEILNRALDLKSGEADDDMTVLVLRLNQAA